MSIDAPGHIELALRDYYETPVVVSHFKALVVMSLLWVMATMALTMQ